MRRTRALALAAALAGCTPAQNGAERPVEDAVRFVVEPQTQPGAFDRRGFGRAVAGGAEGLWAVVADLPRAESAVVSNLETGAEVVLALFRGPPGQGREDIWLSAAAAEALGIDGRPRPVRVTALRREPRLVAGE